MGAAVSIIASVAAVAIPAIIGAIRGSRVEENPTMRAIEEQHRREEEERAEAQRRAEQLERERQEQAERLRREEEAAQRAAQHAEQLEREKQAQAERIRVQQEDAQRAAQHAQQLEKEKQEQAENAKREREAAQRAAQKAMEAKWNAGIRPVEWPSKEKYEAMKRRFYKEGKFHLAIAGISGTGKSSLINAFRGIWDDEPGAAATDIVESTAVVTPYPDPNPANPFIWFDVPGSGTLACSDWTYFNDQGLYIFDAIIVLFNDRFTTTDVAILKNSERYKIPTYIVRSKSDIHLDNIIQKKRRGAGANANPAKVLDEARKEYITRTQESVRLNLMKNDPPIQSQKMYAVSRDTLTMIVREEPLDSDSLLLNEYELLKDILQDAYSRRSEKSYGTMSDLMKKTVLEAQKETESKWHSGIHPVEWPSKEKYEETKRRFYTEGKFHLAITGISGTGKSSLINAFRGIWDDDEGAAMTDIVESTSVVTPYPDPNPDNPFVWFDVPGSGTLACSDWTYFNDQGLYIFDAIIILFNDRFTATDIAILKNSERYNIPTYIVRSKSDIHVENIIKRKRRGAGARRDPASILHEACKEYLTRTQESVRSNLMKNDPPIRSKKLYAVSRDTLTMVVRDEPLEDALVLNEPELLKDLLQDAYSRH
ncbi:P-loop containing nucleoside triphosphate hydrolase protein [Desarmillaria tabescens]|uniref:P-loop containing nucleoside triphosphate hydrolase protein n=1 Tax=Armillaria tabescens TaxID=1929756 RepID=A0AA39NBA8_ARMTA|nr:P-loop containing nucleoside triphosphate hydrolase protein [Desarmillaria tabescens]KAK0462468.1 P-loop containing nucleoside triphosphate hydrolase protein [Desarmillaria tabescens]